MVERGRLDIHEVDLPRPSVEICSLRNMIDRYLTVTMPQDARIATGGNARIIGFLDHNRDRDIFQYDIEQRFSITRSTASRVLGLMERKGLIERRSVERDARLRKIVLTDKADAIADALRVNAAHMEAVLLEGLDGSQVEQLLEYLTVMKSNLRRTGLAGCEWPRQHDGHETASCALEVDNEEGKEANE